jgi:hypothetical protein
MMGKYRPQSQNSETSNHIRRGFQMLRHDKMTKLAILLFAVCMGFSMAWGQTDVLTQHNDNTRSGLNANEAILTPANVTVNSFGKLFAHSVDGIIVGQPLYASNVLMNDGKVHNVVYVATQNNSVYAFDADSNQGGDASPLWSVSLNNGGTADPISDWGCSGIGFTQIGIMGTPVIDPTKTTIYLVAKTVTGSGNNTVRNFTLHALDITSGSERLGGPVVITGTAPSSNTSGTFNPEFQMQRPALLLQNGVLYIGFGGNGCDVYAYNGWLFAYNSQNLQQQSAFLVTPDGKAASIWQGGSGPAVDENGYIYVATANGTYDGPAGGNDYGDTVLKMSWNGNVFGVLDYFTPYNQKALAQEDLDLGSSGPLILPDQPGLYQHELVIGGKQGTLYLVNRDNPGQYNPNTDNVIQSIPKAVASELVGVPSYWNGNVYIAGDADYIKQFSLVNGLLTQTPVSETSVFFGGAGPSSTSISSKANTNAILWVIRHTSPALFAFDPTNLAHELYDSTQALQARDKMSPVVRFVTPTISNGKVYVGGTTALQVFGLLPSLSPSAGNNQTTTEKTVLPLPLSVVASTASAYGSKPLAGASVLCKDGGMGGVFTPATAQTTDATGTVSFNYQTPNKPTAVTITCTSLGYVSAVFNETSAVGPPASFILSSGNNQTAHPSTALSAPLVVKVNDSHGYGVAGVIVNFTDNGAGGFFASSSVTTGPTGIANAQYTTGPKTGKVTINATTSGLKTLTFKVTVQ